jgi:hypothetical protein
VTPAEPDNFSLRELAFIANLGRTPEKLEIYARLCKEDQMAARLWVFLECQDIPAGGRSFPLFSEPKP